MASKSSRVSRRRILRAAGSAAVGGGAVFFGTGAVQGQAPAILTNTQAGRRFKAFVKYSNELPAVVDVTARALTANQVLLRVDAAQTCYTSIDQVLIPGTPTNQATTTPASPSPSSSIRRASRRESQPRTDISSWPVD